MNILNNIILHKQKEIVEQKALYPVKLLETSIYFNSPYISLKKYLLKDDKNGIIAEFKRKSPAKGIINQNASVEKTSIGYMQAGASALSIVTDLHFFGGKNEDLIVARKFNFCPILRRDFLIDEYQIIESKSIGADAIFLLASALDKKRISELAKLAHELGLEVLLEIQNKDEIDTVNEYIDIISVNNENFNDVKGDIQKSIEIAPLIPKGFMKIAENGIETVKEIKTLKTIGYKGFVIGETFMEQSRPEIACANFIKQLKELQN